VTESFAIKKFITQNLIESEPTGAAQSVQHPHGTSPSPPKVTVAAKVRSLRKRSKAGQVGEKTKGGKGCRIGAKGEVLAGGGKVNPTVPLRKTKSGGRVCSYLQLSQLKEGKGETIPRKDALE